MKKILAFLVPLWITGSNIALAAAITDPVSIEGKGKGDVLIMIQNATSWLLGLVLGIGVIMIIVSGVMWMTAGGDATKVGNARKALIYGLIGIAVAIISYSAVSFMKSFLTM